ARGGGRSGATPRVQPWASAVMLPQGRDGLRTRQMVVVWTRRVPSLGRHGHRTCRRQAWLEVPPIVPVLLPTPARTSRPPGGLGAPRASRRETPCQTGRHHGKIARELGVVAIRRAPLVELRHRLRQREAGQPLTVRRLPGTQQALVQLTHVLEQDPLVFRPLAGHHACRGAVLCGHRLLLPRERRPRPAPPATL